MKKLIVVLMLVAISVGCRSAAEQGTVLVETYWGKIVTVHEPGDFFVCASPGCDSHEVDLRDHLDGVDCAGVTSDNIPFYMKVDVVYKPIKEKVPDYLQLFGFEETERSSRRWNVLNQHVKNACRNATSGKYGAYALRAEQGRLLSEMQAELLPKLRDEMALSLSSVGMEIQPQFNDPKIDAAANLVVAAQKQKEAEDALKAAADVKAERQQVEAKIFANPNAMKIEELKLLLEIERVRADGIKGHQGTLILGNPANLQLQLPTGGK